jgi:MFS family permease
MRSWTKPANGCASTVQRSFAKFARLQATLERLILSGSLPGKLRSAAISEAATIKQVKPSRYGHALLALRSRNYKLFFFGQSVSLIGTWMTRIAASWLVYRLTGSAAMLGFVGFAGQIPTFVLAPFAGVLIDRMDRRTVLVWTQALAAVQSLAMAALTLSHRITIEQILWLSVFQGVINAFDMPGRQSALVLMVDEKSQLQSAIALNSSMVNAARLVGPALAGMVIAGVGEGWCFAIDGFSYLAVIVSLLMMRLRVGKPPKTATTMAEQLKDGWSYVTGFRPVRTILLLFALVSLMGIPYVVLMPMFAKNVLGGGAHTLGFLSAAAGVGALVGAVALALRKSVRGLLRWIQMSAAAFGLGLILLGLSHWLWASLLVMTIVGFGMMLGIAASNTVIQTLVTEEKRARVMSYYTMAFMGMAPFGSLMAGFLADHFGPQNTVIFTGTCCILGAAWFSTQLKQVRHAMRPIYAEMGIIPSEPQV